MRGFAFRAWLSAATIGSVLSWLVAPAEAAPCVEPLNSEVVTRIAQAAGPSDGSLESGALGDALVAELVSAVCDAETQRFAAASCASRLGLPDLRRRVALDALRLPATLSRASAGRLSEPQRVALEVLAALIDTLLEQGDFARLLERLQTLPQGTEQLLSQPCSLGAPRPAPAGVGVPLGAAAGLLGQLEQLAKAAQPVAEQIAALEARRGAPFTPLGRDAAGALINRYAALAQATSAEQVGALWLQLISDALVAESGQPQPDFARLSGQLTPLLSGDPRSSLKASLELLRGFNLAPPDAVDTSLDVTAALAVARDERTAKVAIARAVLPIGPWAENLLADLNVGAVSLSDRGLNIAGDALLGYQGSSVGGDVRGALYEYDLSDDSSILQISQREVQLEGWVALGSDAVQFEGRLEGRYVYLDSTRFSSTSDFLDETSNLARGLLLLGLRAQPSSGAALGVWLGAGYQYEDYSPLLVSRTQSVILTDESSSALVLEGRLRAQLAVWPRYVALRIRGDGTRYSVSRQSETLLFAAGGNSVIQTSDTSVVTEIHGRAFLDAEVARFFGFVPGLFGGLDYLSVDSSADGAVSAVSPVFGAGVRQVSF